MSMLIQLTTSFKFKLMSFFILRVLLYQDCNADCNCNQAKFSPVCGPDEKTNYFSPCFAGCKKVHQNFSVIVKINLKEKPNQI